MIRVRFFGRFSDMVTEPEGLELNTNQADTVADIVAVIASRNPELHEAITAPQVSVAVNQNLTNLEARVKDGDEVAFLPPVTGG